MYRHYSQIDLPPDIYISNKTGKGIIVIDDRHYFVGKTKLKKDKYVYFQYRSGKKIIDIYLGKKRLSHWLKDGVGYF